MLRRKRYSAKCEFMLSIYSVSGGNLRSSESSKVPRFSRNSPVLAWLFVFIRQQITTRVRSLATGLLKREILTQRGRRCEPRNCWAGAESVRACVYRLRRAYRRGFLPMDFRWGLVRVKRNARGHRLTVTVNDLRRSRMFLCTRIADTVSELAG